MNELERRFYTIARTYPPDFDTLTKLLQQGVDINACTGPDPKSNLLSDVIEGYNHSWGWDDWDGRTEEEGSIRKASEEDSIQLKGLQAVVQFFLDHGFDCQRTNGGYGEECIYLLLYIPACQTTIDLCVLLLDALDLPQYEESQKELLFEYGCQCGIQFDYGRYWLWQYYETLYRIVHAATYQRNYHAIGLYSQCIGKTVTRIALGQGYGRDADPSKFFDTRLYPNCYKGTLLMEVGEDVLCVNEFHHIAMDSTLDPIESPLLEERLSPCIGQTIQSIDFQTIEYSLHGMEAPRDIIRVRFENGLVLHVSRNFDPNYLHAYESFVEILPSENS